MFRCRRMLRRPDIASFSESLDSLYNRQLLFPLLGMLNMIKIDIPGLDTLEFEHFVSLHHVRGAVRYLFAGFDYFLFLIFLRVIYDKIISCL